MPQGRGQGWRWSISLDRLAIGCAVLVAAACPGVAAQNRPLLTADGVLVRALKFEGNHALDDETLAMSIATSQSGWARRYWWIRWLGLGEKRTFDEIEFRRDVVRLQLLYRLNGYYDARVDTAVVRQPDHVEVTFRIQEGPPIVVDSIALVRTDGVAMPRLGGRLPLRVHDPLNRLLFDESADTIRNALRERGSPFAAVFRNYTVDNQARRAVVEYDVDPGPRARIGEIVVDSAVGVRPALVRRFLTMRVGDPYRQSDLFESQRTLYQTDMFRFVAVGLAPDSVVRGSDSLVRLRVTVAEGPRARARVGAGYGTSDCFRTQATTTVANALGGGRRLDLVGQLSKIGVGVPTALGFDNTVCPGLASDQFSDTVNYTASATITQPALFTRRTSGSFSLFAERRSEYRAYQNINVGAAVGFSFGSGIPAGAALTYRIAQSRTIATPASFCTSFDRCDTTVTNYLLSPKREGSLTLSLTDIKTNLPVDPTTGHSYTFAATTAARALGSEVVFSKAVAEAIWYTPVSPRVVLAVRVRAGTIHAGVGEIAGQEVAFVPPEERFYMGGSTTLRGYGRNAMGPVVYVAPDTLHVTTSGDTVTACQNCRISALGGSSVVLGSLELRMPSPIWPARMRWVVFVDAGQLWGESGTPPTGIKITPGVGLRFATPLGPMRLDVGYNGYAPQSGPVYALVADTLVKEGARDFRPGLQPGLLHRLQFNFSVGQAF